jgi:hypothetical protein
LWNLCATRRGIIETKIFFFFSFAVIGACWIRLTRVPVAMDPPLASRDKGFDTCYFSFIQNVTNEVYQCFYFQTVTIGAPAVGTTTLFPLGHCWYYVMMWTDAVLNGKFCTESRSVGIGRQNQVTNIGFL